MEPNTPIEETRIAITGTNKLDKNSYLPPRESYPFRSPYNANDLKKEREIISSLTPSQTVPDQSLSVKEILTRYAQGLPLAGEKIPVYEGEEESIPANWDKMDLSERADYVEHHAKKIKQMQRNLEQQEEERINAAAKKLVESQAPKEPEEKPAKNLRKVKNSEENPE